MSIIKRVIEKFDNEKCFFMAFTIYLFIRIIELSVIPIDRWLINFVRIIIALIIAIKTFYFEEINKRQLFYMVFALLLGIIIWINAKSFYLLDVIILLIGSINVDFIKLIKVFRRTIITLIFVIVILSLIGAIENYVYFRNGVARYSFGFIYPTDFAALVFYALLSDLLLCFIEKRKVMYRYLTYFVVSLILYVFCDARLTTICILLLIILNIYIRKNEQISQNIVIKFILKHCISIFAFMSILVVQISILFPYNSLLSFIDKLLSYRIYYSKIGVLNHGYSIFGQYIKMQGVSLSGVNDYFYLDSSYMNIALRYGIVALIIMCIMYSKRLSEFSDIGFHIIAPIVFIISINSLIGQQFLDLLYNPFLLIFFTKFPSQLLNEKNIKEYYLSEPIINGKDAGNKARNDVEKIMSKRFIPLYPYKFIANKSILLKLFAFLVDICKTGQNDYIYIQYPLPMGYNRVLNFVSFFRNTIIIIHDLTELRIGNYSGNEIKRFRNVQFIVSHNQCMSEFISSHGIDCNKIVNLEIFDYLSKYEIVSTHEDDNEFICFAGNLSKSPFIYDISTNVLKLGLNLYGINFDESKNKEGITYRGAFDSEEIHCKIAGKFGLIWDGNDCNTCTGAFGNYMKYNNPHKISMYLAAAMPVIVWKDSAIAKIVESNEIGYLIEKIDDIIAINDNMTKEKYTSLVKNVTLLQADLLKGRKLNNALDIIRKKIIIYCE